MKTIRDLVKKRFPKYSGDLLEVHVRVYEADSRFRGLTGKDLERAWAHMEKQAKAKEAAADRSRNERLRVLHPELSAALDDAEADAAEERCRQANAAAAGGSWAAYHAIKDPAERTRYWQKHKGSLKQQKETR